MKVIVKNSLILLCFLILSGCVSDSTYVPVENGWLEPNASASGYRVNDGDTLYSIAWSFGLDYRALAQANNLLPPYSLTPGQVLVMTTVPFNNHNRMQVPIQERPSQTIYNPSFRQSTLPHTYPTTSRSFVRFRPVINQGRGWRWPVRGIILRHYSGLLVGNQGIDIAGKVGRPIRAAANGEIVYRGDGVRGYGNLIIIKHSDDYLSAYAFLHQMRVRLGDHVDRGQVIATMGRNNAGKALLHFEIRLNGKPVNPLRYLH